MLCTSVLPVVHNCYLFLYMQCLEGLHYISLYALSLHSTLAHLWVPFSSGVSWNKRGIEGTKTLILLHKLQFYLLKLICTLCTTYLNLMLGVPLTDLNHLSAFTQVSGVEPSAISPYSGSAYTGTG